MEKIIFFGLAIPILAFVIYLGGGAIMKGFSAKVSNRPNKDEDEIEKQRENYVQITEKDDIVTSTLFNSIISVDGITDRVKIHKFINNMPARDSKMLRNYIRDISPGLDMDIDVECPKCQTTSSVRLPINSELFYPE